MKIIQIQKQDKTIQNKLKKVNNIDEDEIENFFEKKKLRLKKQKKIV